MKKNDKRERDQNLDEYYRQMIKFLKENNINNYNDISNNIPNACRYCYNHPYNGGNGICHCILGSSIVT